MTTITESMASIGGQEEELTARNDNIVLVAIPWLPLISGIDVFRAIGVFALFLIALGLVNALFRNGGRRETRGVLFAILFLFLVGVYEMHSVQAQTFVQTIQLSLICLAIFAGPGLRFNQGVVWFSVVSCVLLSAFAIFDVQLAASVIFENPNASGMAAMCWAAVVLKLQLPVRQPLGWFWLVASLFPPVVLVVLSASRASQLAVAIMITWPVLRNLLPGHTVRTFVALLVLVLPLLILGVVSLGAFDEVQALIPEAGEKSLFSGRDIIWFEIFTQIVGNDFRGFGLGSLPLLVGYYEDLSAHNGYLQLLYQFGAIGLAVFLLACALLIVAMSRRQDCGISVAIFMGALVHEMFEVTLTQNHFGSGILIWLVVVISTVTVERSDWVVLDAI